MRILYLSQLIPYPADAGPKVRIYNVLQYLVEAGHEVTFAAFRREDDTQEQLDHISQLCSEMHTVLMQRSRVRDAWYLGTSLLRKRPFLIDRDSVAEMHTLVKKLVQQNQYDAVHADQLWMAQYALTAKEVNPHITTVLDQHNAMYLIPERLAESSGNLLLKNILKLEAKNMAQFEVEMCQVFDKVVWVTQEDKTAVTQIANGAANQINGPVIPICVDPAKKPIINRRQNAHRVTFLGGLHWPPNAAGIIWFAKEVWPAVQQAVPEATLTIIGKNPPEELSKLGLSNLEITGYLPDVASYLQETAVFVVPLHAGGGMRVKIVDGWSWGLPIVSTSIGAEGISYRDGYDLLLADTAESFIDAVIRLLQNQDFANLLADNGRETLEVNYDWQKIYSNWDTIYERS